MTFFSFQFVFVEMDFLSWRVLGRSLVCFGALLKTNTKPGGILMHATYLFVLLTCKFVLGIGLKLVTQLVQLPAGLTNTGLLSVSLMNGLK